MDIDGRIAEGWQVSDLINWVPFHMRETILSVIGTEGVVLEEDSIPHNGLWKAKILISPEGIKNLALFFMPAAGSA